jgi:sulfite reductase (NADPH) flavoprotein alpha-component
MVGPGTGLAPFRAFLQERKFQNAKGKNWLFFGDQTRNNDFIYENEIYNLKQSGFLNKLDLAFSRDQEEKNYVQHKMYSSRKELFHWIDQGAYFYVCGDATHMAKDVDNMLHQVIQEELKTSYEKAKEYIKNLKTQKRYLRDVY